MCREIDEYAYSVICELCKLGDNYAPQKDFNQALQKYEQEFDLVPEPFYIYNASTWVLTAAIFRHQYQKLGRTPFE